MNKGKFLVKRFQFVIHCEVKLFLEKICNFIKFEVIFYFRFILNEHRNYLSLDTKLKRDDHLSILIFPLLSS